MPADTRVPKVEVTHDSAGFQGSISSSRLAFNVLFLLLSPNSYIHVPQYPYPAIITELILSVLIIPAISLCVREYRPPPKKTEYRRSLHAVSDSYYCTISTNWNLSSRLSHPMAQCSTCNVGHLPFYYVRHLSKGQQGSHSWGL